MIQRTRRGPIHLDGAPFPHVCPQGNKKAAGAIPPAAAKFPLTEEKNHGKIRRLYDGRGYSAIFYR